jgi:hypothetical protein
MRSLLAAVALGVLVAVPATAPPAPAARAETCVSWDTAVQGSRSGLATLAPTIDCRAEGVPAAAAAAAPPVGTGISGRVRRGPIRPVCVAGLPCDAPAAGVLVEIDSGRTVVARLRTEKDGRFLLRTPPGSYVVRVVAKRAAPVMIRVRAGFFSRVSLSIDTRIR